MGTEPTGQSPINLKNAYVIDIKDVEFNYPSRLSVTVTADHETIKCTPVTKSAPAYIIIDNERYDLLQFHTHTPSEHTIDGKGYKGEMHFVHKNKKGNKLAVVGVLIDTDLKAPKDALTPLTNLLKKIPAPKRRHKAAIINDENQETLRMETASKTSKTLGTISLAIYDILPKNKQMYRYSGSLTTPPYTEGVEWNVFSTPITTSPHLISKIKAFTAENTAREIQLATTPLVLDEVSEKLENRPTDAKTMLKAK